MAAPQISPDEMIKIQEYLRRTFGNPNLGVKPRPKASDSLEVLVNGEFLGLLYKTIEEDETSYDFNMSILDIDLEDQG